MIWLASDRRPQCGFHQKSSAAVTPAHRRFRRSGSWTSEWPCSSQWQVGYMGYALDESDRNPPSEMADPVIEVMSDLAVRLAASQLAAPNGLHRGRSSRESTAGR